MRSRTFNRRKLKNDIAKGLLLCRRKYRYSDDYAWDAETNYGKTEYKDAQEMGFDDEDFRGYGKCWIDDNNGEITLYFGYESYSLVYKDNFENFRKLEAERLRKEEADRKQFQERRLKVV